MGAFDTYAAAARCPRCRDVHWLSGQNKFFDPDFMGLFHRHFVPGSEHPLDVDTALLLRDGVWECEWWRVRDAVDLDDIRLLADWDEQFACTCGTPLAIVMRFKITEKTATLTALELREALAEELPGEIDFAEAPPGLWTGDSKQYAAALAALAAQPFADRAGRLREEFVARFGGPWPPAPEGWTTLIAPVRCEACGDVRERTLWTLLTHPDYPSPLGASWTGGVLRPGDRVAADLGWLAEDVDRGIWARLRQPISPDRLVLLSSPHRWGCPCGAGPASLVTTFAREADGLHFAGAALRVVRGRGDLADIDFAEGGTVSRDMPPTPGPRWRPASREEAIAALLNTWRVF